MATTDRSENVPTFDVPTSIERLESEAEAFRATVAALTRELAKQIVGYADAIERVIAALLCGGHVLIEGVPGLGKTVLVKTLAAALRTDFARIQCTPDLMPADILGTHVVVEDAAGARTFQFQRGPIFSHVVLADEINRATPKTQAALLEAMQEGAVTLGGTTYRLAAPFLVLGTQNPIEMEGTYPLPEAQLDRFFFKLHLALLGEAELARIVELTTGAAPPPIEPVADAARVIALRDLVRRVAVADHVTRYAVRLVVATHPGGAGAPEAVRRNVRYGASPRGIQALILAGKVRALTRGRLCVGCDDVRHAAHPALRHRILLNFEGEAAEVSTDALIDRILETTPEIGPVS